MVFGNLFEQYFLNQGFEDNRSIETTLDLGWDLISVLPKAELDRVDNEVLEKFYDCLLYTSFISVIRMAHRFEMICYTLFRKIRTP